MPSAARTLRPISLPAGEMLPPGWFALSPDQYENDAQREQAHGRWFRIASGHGAVFRALQLTPGLPRDGIVLDWSARHRLEGGHAGAGSESLPLRLEVRPARLLEYPRCLLSHPSPAARLGGQTVIAALLICIAALVATLVLGLSTRPSATPAPTAVALPGEAIPLAVTDVAGFRVALAGNWQGPGEQLMIKHDKAVLEILRQTQLDSGEWRIDQYVAAPVKLDAAQRSLQVETPDGSWQLTLLPGARRAQLSITYADRRNVLYQ